MYPRQYDARLECCRTKFGNRSLDLTDNFFPRMSFGTNVFENTKTPNYAWIFTDSTTESNPYPTYQGANCTKLQLIMLDVSYTNIIQRLKALMYKDCMSKLLSYYAQRS